jgi:hypothetical protein
MVGGLDAAPPAVAAGEPSAPGEEAIDERAREGDLTRATREEEVVSGGGEPEDDEEREPPSSSLPGDREAPVDLPDPEEEAPRCARCGRAGVEQIGAEGAEEAGDVGNVPWLRRVRPARRTRSAP